MEVVISFIFAILIFYLIAYPFFEKEVVNYSKEISSLKVEKSSLKKVLRLYDQLEFDYLLNNISEEKYRHFKKEIKNIISKF
ncbi:hypothetical protein [Natronospora cellulosivora (SeqCode)]